MESRNGRMIGDEGMSHSKVEHSLLSDDEGTSHSMVGDSLLSNDEALEVNKSINVIFHHGQY